MPIAPVLSSTGHPTLGVTNAYSIEPSTYTAGTSYVNVTSGSAVATTDGSVLGYFSIDFGTFDGAQLVTFSGAQFELYLSEDGLAQISAGDIKYTGPTLFNVNDLTTNTGWYKYTETNGTFYVGQTTGGQEVVTGPIPPGISSAYKYVKIYDGSATAVAVSAQYVTVAPGSTTTRTTTSTVTSTSTTITTSSATITQTTTLTQTTTQPTTVTQATTQTETTVQPTTFTQLTTHTETTTQPTTTTVTTTTTSVSTSTSSSNLSLGVAVIVTAIVAALAAWVLRGRRL